MVAKLATMSAMSDPDSTRQTLLLRLRNRTDEVSWQEFHERVDDLAHAQ